MVSNFTEKFRTECWVDSLFVREDTSEHTTPVQEFSLDLEGIVHDSLRSKKYRGFTRVSDRRAPWLPTNVEIRNTRQLSLLSIDDLASLAADLEVPSIQPQWLNANILVSGIAHFSSLPRGTRLRLADGASLIVEDRTAPCRGSGGAVKKFYPERERFEFEFVAAAAALRGLLCTVELGGTIGIGQRIEVLVPHQWIYDRPAKYE